MKYLSLAELHKDFNPSFITRYVEQELIHPGIVNSESSKESKLYHKYLREVFEEIILCLNNSKKYYDEVLVLEFYCNHDIEKVVSTIIKKVLKQKIVVIKTNKGVFIY